MSVHTSISKNSSTPACTTQASKRCAYDLRWEWKNVYDRQLRRTTNCGSVKVQRESPFAETSVSCSQSLIKRFVIRNRYNGLSRKEICILFESYIAKSSKRYSFTIRDDVIIKKRQENGYFVIISGNQYASCIMCESSRYVMEESRRITISDITYTLFCAYTAWGGGCTQRVCQISRCRRMKLRRVKLCVNQQRCNGISCATRPSDFDEHYSLGNLDFA